MRAIVVSRKNLYIHMYFILSKVRYITFTCLYCMYIQVEEGIDFGHSANCLRQAAKMAGWELPEELSPLWLATHCEERS